MKKKPALKSKATPTVIPVCDHHDMRIMQDEIEMVAPIVHMSVRLAYLRFGFTTALGLFPVCQSRNPFPSGERVVRNVRQLP
jgi:hypothetical protein